MKKNTKPNTIVFFAMALSQPRCIKRVLSLKEAGFRCVVYGYDRGKYDINTYPSDVAVYNLGFVQDNEYYEKTKKVYHDIRNICKKHSSEDIIFYAFGIIPALFLKLLRKRYVYEISDILYAYPRFRRIMFGLKCLDKKIIHSSLATVMTSGGFYSFFNIKSKKIFIVPNKVSPSLQRPSFKNELVKRSTNLRFGFVGSLRYKTILNFAEVIGEFFPNYEFHFWGGTNNTDRATINSITEKYANVVYHGAFQSPSDLPKVYDSFDLTVSCYQVNSLNERIAEPNKLYESMFFCKPIIVSDGIYLSDRVKEFDCGFCMDASSKEKIREFVSSLKVENIVEIVERISHISDKSIVNNQSELNDYLSQSFMK